MLMVYIYEFDMKILAESGCLLPNIPREGGAFRYPVFNLPFPLTPSYSHNSVCEALSS